jgi:hypothetical protein
LVTCDDVYRLADARLERLRQDLGSEHPTVRALGELVASVSWLGRAPERALEKTATYLRRSKTRQGRIPDAAPFTARPRPARASFDPAATALQKREGEPSVDTDSRLQLKCTAAN